MNYALQKISQETQDTGETEDGEKMVASFNSVSDLYNEVFVTVTETVLEIFRELSVSWIIFRNWG